MFESFVIPQLKASQYRIICWIGISRAILGGILLVDELL
jgi:hypothetical protein